MFPLGSQGDDGGLHAAAAIGRTVRPEHVRPAHGAGIRHGDLPRRDAELRKSPGVDALEIEQGLAVRARAHERTERRAEQRLGCGDDLRSDLKQHDDAIAWLESALTQGRVPGCDIVLTDVYLKGELTGKDLVVVKDKAVAQRFDRMFPNREKIGGRSINIHGAAYSQGQADGGRASLHRSMPGQSGPIGIGR